MAASIAQPTTKITRKPTHKQAAILKTKKEHPNLTTREVAAICDTDHTHVLATYKRYGIDSTHVDQYKRHRADLLAGLQDKLLASITNEDIQKAPMGSRVLAAAQLYDKERLELDKSTSNVGVMVDLIKRIQGQDGA
jgi:hypothetical protein